MKYVYYCPVLDNLILTQYHMGGATTYLANTEIDGKYDEKVSFRPGGPLFYYMGEF